MRQFKPSSNKNHSRTLKEARKQGRSRISGTLFFYLGRQYLLFFIVCLIGFSFLFLIGELLDQLHDFLEADAGFWQISAFFLYRQSVHLVHVLPISILLSVSYVLSTLARNHEITAVRASGISVVQFCLPIWLGAALAGAALFWLNEAVMFRHEEISERIKHEILTGGAEEKSDRENIRLAYHNHSRNRYWFFENFDQHGVQEGVSVKQFDTETNSIDWEIRAAKAEHKQDGWLFSDGYFFEYSPEDTLPVREEPFQKYETDELQEKPRDIYVHLRPTENMNLQRIRAFLRDEEGAAPGTLRIFRTMAWHRLTLPLSCILTALLGVGMNAGRSRVAALRGFACAVGLTALYYVVNQVLLVMGNHNILPPFIAGALPTLAFTAGGIWLVHKNR